MALQDLTPQLRTRLSRMERAVGWFVTFAVVLLVIGFAYYLHNTAKRRGWFLEKISYQTCVSSGAGLKVGDPVRLMGFDVGEITAVIPNDPYDYYNITIQFRVKLDHYDYPGYIWSDSQVKVSSELLGNRFLEITKGVRGVPTTSQFAPNSKRAKLDERKYKTLIQEIERDILKDETSAEAAEAHLDPDTMERMVLAEANRRVSASPASFYTNNTSPFLLVPLESPAVADRIDKLVSQVEKALPNILALTNQLNATLANSTALTSNLNVLAVTAQPAAANLAAISERLRNPGALGEWTLGPDGQRDLTATLASANRFIGNTDTNLAALAESLALSLENLAGITSNLHAQVNANTNVLSEISQAVIHADELVQGLKKHWLLRSSFKEKKPAK